MTTTRSTAKTKRTATRSKPKVEPNNNSQKQKRAYARAEDFTAQERIVAVTAALTANAEHPTGRRALDAACAALHTTIHVSTLHDWLHLYRDQVRPMLITKPIDQVIIDQRDSTLADMNAVRQLAIQELQDKAKAKEASWRDTAVVFGI